MAYSLHNWHCWCLVKKLGADINNANYAGCTPLYNAVGKGDFALVRCMVKELGADVNQATANGTTPLHRAAYYSDLAIYMVQCLVNELGADVNQADRQGTTHLYIAAQMGHLAMVRLLVKELGTDINHINKNGSTPLMVASVLKHVVIVRWLVNAGANTQAVGTASGTEFTTATISKTFGASPEQTAYLEAKTHCPSPGCIGAGLLKCTGCRQARYCGEAC
jgi:ankyrin repeat protein